MHNYLFQIFRIILVFGLLCALTLAIVGLIYLLEGDSEPYEGNRVSDTLSLKKPGSGQRKSIAEKNDHSLQLKTPENEAIQKSHELRTAHRNQ